MGWACWMPKLQTHTDINQLQSVCQWAGPAGCQNYKHTQLQSILSTSTSIGMSMGWACWMPKLQTHTDIINFNRYVNGLGLLDAKTTNTWILINFNRYVNGLGLLDAKTTNTRILINFNRYVNGLGLLDAKTTQNTRILINFNRYVNGLGLLVAKTTQTHTDVNKRQGGRSDRSFMVDPLSYFSVQPVLHDWCYKGCGMLSCLWDNSYKRTLAANWKE